MVIKCRHLCTYKITYSKATYIHKLIYIHVPIRRKSVSFPFHSQWSLHIVCVSDWLRRLGWEGVGMGEGAQPVNASCFIPSRQSHSSLTVKSARHRPSLIYNSSLNFLQQFQPFQNVRRNPNNPTVKFKDLSGLFSFLTHWAMFAYRAYS